MEKKKIESSGAKIKFELKYQIYDEHGGKDSIIPLVEFANLKEEAILSAENKLKKILRTNWSFKLTGETK